VSNSVSDDDATAKKLVTGYGLWMRGTRTAVVADFVLDNPVWASLTGAHAHLAEARTFAARYPAGVAPFAAVADPADAQSWQDLAALIGPGARALVTGVSGPPDEWEVVEAGTGVQLVDSTLRAEHDTEAIVLTADDVPEILTLVERTKPGPFLPRTIELGSYFGIRRDDALVAMAGERLHPPGWTEISAVCTDPAYRGQGLATRLVRTVAAGIRDRGETPFLHAAAANTNAIRLYESIGFVLRRTTRFQVVRAPGGLSAASSD
jgi:ribosomal protein S18 acetylase RimI-like enzyme